MAQGIDNSIPSWDLESQRMVRAKAETIETSGEIARLKDVIVALEAGMNELTSRVGNYNVMLDRSQPVTIDLTKNTDTLSGSTENYEAALIKARDAVENFEQKEIDLLSALAGGLITQQAYNDEMEFAKRDLDAVAGATALYESQMEQATGVTQGATIATKQLKEQLSEAEKETIRINDAVGKFNETMNAEIDGLQRILSAYELNEEAGKAMEKQIALENEVRQAGVDVTGEQGLAMLKELELRDQISGAIDQQKEKYSEINDIAKATAEEQQRAWEQLADSIQGGLSDAFVNIFDSARDGFKAVVDDIANWFKKLIADLIAHALANRVVIPIIAGIVGGAPNLAGAAGNDPLGGFGSILSGGSNILGLGGLLGGGAAAGGIPGLGGFIWWHREPVRWCCWWCWVRGGSSRRRWFIGRTRRHSIYRSHSRSYHRCCCRHCRVDQ